jgi:plastocyanin domain-containing protein
MDKLFVSFVGIGFIGAIYWFFFGKKEKPMEAQGSITITVDGGYKPKILRVPKDKTTTLIFLRKDANTCLEELIIPDFMIKKYLPMHTPVAVSISPRKPGTYNFHCGMNMFHGTIEVNS